MKFHRVEGKLPASVTLCVASHGIKPKAAFGNLFEFEQLVDSIGRHVSNVPTTFTLDVPENVEIETARVLREMADELEGKS